MNDNEHIWCEGWADRVSKWIDEYADSIFNHFKQHLYEIGSTEFSEESFKEYLDEIHDRRDWPTVRCSWKTDWEEQLNDLLAPGMPDNATHMLQWLEIIDDTFFEIMNDVSLKIREQRKRRDYQLTKSDQRAVEGIRDKYPWLAQRVHMK